MNLKQLTFNSICREETQIFGLKRVIMSKVRSSAGIQNR